jgi:uncharacterized protein with HEPN domain
LSRVDPETFDRIPGSNEAVATRNLIAHGYDSVDHRLLWSVGTQFLPEMLRVIDTILEDM